MRANKYNIWVLERFLKDDIAFFGRLVLPDPTIGVIEQWVFLYIKSLLINLMYIRETQKNWFD